MYVTGNDASDAYLAEDDFALLAGMLLDQQVTMEKAFAGPWVLKERLGEFTPESVANMNVDDFVAVCATPPAIHRFPASMGARLHQMAVTLVDNFEGSATNVWADATSGADLFKRLRTLPGFGEQKARIFVALLAKQRGVRPQGWQKAAGDYGLDGFRSVADITDEESLLKVRATKKDAKAAAKAVKTASS